MCTRARSYRVRSGEGFGEGRRGHAGGRCRNCTCGEDRSAPERGSAQTGTDIKPSGMELAGPVAIAPSGGYGRGS